MEQAANNESESLWPGILFGLAIVGFVEFLIYATNTLYSSFYWVGILVTAVSAHMVIQEKLVQAQKEDNAQLTLLSLVMYIPLAGVLYLLVNHLLTLIDIAV